LAASKRAVAADDDDRVEAVGLHGCQYGRDAALVLLGVVTGGAQDRATTLEKTARLGQREGRDVTFDDPAPTMVEAEYLIAVR